MLRTVTTRASLRVRQAAPGFVEGTVSSGEALNLDPFIAITDFHMSQPIFAPHPHAGFSAVTYMFTDSQGSFTNRDSRGNESFINPGGIHWTQAGSGMMHEEIPVTRGVDCHGLQLFVNLKSSNKMTEPKAFSVDASHVPEVQPSAGVRVRVVVGAAHGARSPLEGLLTEVTILDIALAPGTSVEEIVAPEDRAVVLVLDGSLSVSGEAARQHDVLVLDAPADVINLTTSEGATVLLLVGAPMNEPVVLGGPFVMNTNDQIADAKRRFQRGEMGQLAPSF